MRANLNADAFRRVNRQSGEQQTPDPGCRDSNAPGGARGDVVRHGHQIPEELGPTV
jgi:hypothetical protein